MFVKLLLSSFTNKLSNQSPVSPQTKQFLHHIKNYKRTGIKLREAILLSIEGTPVVRDGNASLTSNDLSVSIPISP